MGSNLVHRLYSPAKYSGWHCLASLYGSGSCKIAKEKQQSLSSLSCFVSCLYKYPSNLNSTTPSTMLYICAATFNVLVVEGNIIRYVTFTAFAYRYWNSQIIPGANKLRAIIRWIRSSHVEVAVSHSFGIESSVKPLFLVEKQPKKFEDSILFIHLNF